ncbi:amino acid ABC transporter permease [Xinfangfangia sp. CPCC 101601]|uniref:Amino acid ABC transporter permease n=1 Tax=Pseudogemmobacter lacusdianii TaxID=3069608 RepID=A0ABU0W2C7_9RHOB|nr:amino acid ABC transporter permease [Xinfangfangia sp. CPCC 101601]MDQ2068117.1 amino acid ABC transporter permease [Xinfangfangia sp. CPCC 101601]
MANSATARALPPISPLKTRLRKSFFPTPLSGAISLAGMAFAAWALWHLFQWAAWNAVFIGTAEDCRAASGACWAVIADRWRLMFFGLYPHEEHWRSALGCLILILVIILSCLPVFWRPLRLAVLWVCSLAVFILLMRGGVFGLSYVGEERWGGLTLSIFIFCATALIGMPLSIALALLRRSSLPLVSVVTGMVIDSVRSLPLVTILFAVAVVLPILAPGSSGTKIMRVIAGMALFFAAYQSEILRSGIQSLPVGQDEAAKSLGLGYWHRMTRIILPQAFRRALPPTVSQFAISFKEVSLVIIIGVFDFLASGNAAYGSGEWAFTYVEVYVFMAFVNFIFIFSLSRYGAYLERRMRVGK